MIQFLDDERRVLGGVVDESRAYLREVWSVRISWTEGLRCGVACTQLAIYTDSSRLASNTLLCSKIPSNIRLMHRRSHAPDSLVRTPHGLMHNDRPQL